MRHCWKFLTLFLFLSLNRPVPAYFDGGFELPWSTHTSVYYDSERVYATGTTEAPFDVFWTDVSTSLGGPGGGNSGSDHSYGSWAVVQISVLINGQHGYYSASSNHSYMGTDGLGDYDYTMGGANVPAPPPPPPPPSISGISPSSAVAGTSGSIQVSGSGFRPGAALSSSGSGLAVSGNYSGSGGSISGNYTATTPGNYTVYVTQDTGTASASFTVGDPTPSISSITPNAWPNATTTPVTIQGSGFGSNPSVQVDGSGITYVVTQRSNASIQLQVTVDGEAPPGQATVTVTSNGYGGSGFISSTPGQAQQSTSTASKAIVEYPVLSCPGSVTRGSDVSCVVTGIGSSRVKSWQFIAGGSTYAGPSGTSSSWAGTMVAGGTVRVTVASFSAKEASITVVPRAWSTSPADPVQMPGNALGARVLPAPPAAGGDSGLGAYELALDNAGLSFIVMNSGPNTGFAYFAAPLTFTAKYFRYIIHTHLEDSGSEFSRRQCGAGGFILRQNLLAQTRRHEYDHPSQSHHGRYVQALADDANNLDKYLESVVGPPGQSLYSLGIQIQVEIQSRTSRITSASAVEPYGVNESASGSFLGDINYAPYNSICP